MAADDRTLQQGTARRVGSVVMAVLIAVAVLALNPVAALADVEFGAQFHGTWSDYSDSERAQVLDTLQANGATTVRIDVSWRMLQPDGPGEFDAWGAEQVDAAITAAVQRGLRPLVTLWMSPQWATGSTDERVAPSTPSALKAWRNFTRTMATEYDGRVLAWEVWNEPNHDDFMRGAEPRVYAKVLKYAYRGLKAGSPGTPVVFGGAQYVDTDWIHKVFAAGGTTYDVMGVHPYQGVADQAPETRDNGTMWRMTSIPDLRALMVAHGQAAKKIWFTEFGWQVTPTSANPSAANWERGVSAKVQAAYLVRTLKYVRAHWPYVTKVYWYKDRADSVRDDRTGYGLVKPDGSPTLALAAAKTYLGR